MVGAGGVGRVSPHTVTELKIKSMFVWMYRAYDLKINITKSVSCIISPEVRVYLHCKKTYHGKKTSSGNHITLYNAFRFSQCKFSQCKF